MRKLSICLLSALFVLSMAACTDETHTHSYSNDFSYNATHHWHEATCGCDNLVSEKEEHSFVNDVCSDCGYKRGSTPVDPPVDPPVKPGVDYDTDSDVLFDGDEFQ